MTGDQAMHATVTERQHRFESWATDVLVYIVVLNLFVEFNDAIIIESFWISILTAVLLQGLISIVKRLEHRVGDFFEQRGGTLSRVLGITVKFLILFTSKLIILEVVNFVFGDEVELGHFVDVLVLILTMMAARAIVGKIYVSLGEIEPSKE
jgi:hypothetical protein